MTKAIVVLADSKQAKKLGDWHKFIENFEATDEGFEMVMGS